METAGNYNCINGAELFFEERQLELFRQLLVENPKRIVRSDYLEEGGSRTLYLKIKVGGPELRRVCLKYDQTTEGEYLIAVIESSGLAIIAAPPLLLTLMRWQGRPIYTPTLSDDHRPVLGCSRRKSALHDLNDLYDMTIGLAEAMEQIEVMLQNQSLFPYLWSNIPAAGRETR